MTVKHLAIGAAACALAAIAAQPALAQSERMPGGVERSQEAPDAAASGSVKPSTAPRMGTTRGLTGAPKPPPAAVVPPAPVVPPATTAPATRGVPKSLESAPPAAAPAAPGQGSRKGFDEKLPGGVERAPGNAQ